MEVNQNKKKALLAASVAGLLAITGIVATASVAYAEDVKCAGVNACKGTGECGGKGHGCAGKNECKGQGWVKKATAEECTAAGGTVPVTEEAAAQ